MEVHAPRSPWFSGFYERLIGIMKGCLKKCLYKKCATTLELHTILTEIEVRMSNHPLRYQTDDINDAVPLTPAHLLCGHTIETFTITPCHDDYSPVEITHEKLIAREQQLNKILEQWNRAWQNDYLLSLRERFNKKACTSTFGQEIKVGDIYLVKEQIQRSGWPLGKIVQVFLNERDTIRVVKVKFQSGEMLHSIKHLYPLEASLDQEGKIIHPCKYSTSSQNLEVMGVANTQPTSSSVENDS